MDSKVCSKCKAEKPVSDFYRNRRMPDGFAGWCKRCFTAMYEGKQIAVDDKVCSICRERKPARDFAKTKKSKDRLHHYCRACSSVKTKVHYRKNAEAYRFNAWARRYGLSREGFEVMWHAQGGKCAICTVALVLAAGRGRGTREDSPCVDHDHRTGGVRAILCSGCNAGIGNLGHDPARVMQAANYLLHHA